jgi:hypothetical protein
MPYFREHVRLLHIYSAGLQAPRHKKSLKKNPPPHLFQLHMVQRQRGPAAIPLKIRIRLRVEAARRITGNLGRARAQQHRLLLALLCKRAQTVLSKKAPQRWSKGLSRLAQKPPPLPRSQLALQLALPSTPPVKLETRHLVLSKIKTSERKLRNK